MWVVKMTGGMPDCNGAYVRLYQPGMAGPMRLTLTVWLTKDIDEAHNKETYQEAKRLAEDLDWFGQFEPAPLPGAPLTLAEQAKIVELLRGVMGTEADKLVARLQANIATGRDVGDE